MSDEEIIDELLGKEVRVFCSEFEKDELKEFSGKILDVGPRYFLRLEKNSFSGGHIVFCGIGDGIYKIIDSHTDRLYYQNESIIGAYKNRLVEDDKTRDELREKGIFYI